MNINAFSGGFIKADIENSFIIPVYVSLFFFYSFAQYYLQLDNEYSAHSNLVSSIQGYGNHLALYIFKRELRNMINGFNEANYSFSVVGKNPRQEESTYKAQCNGMPPEQILEYNDKIINNEGFSVADNVLSFTYLLTEKDIEFYNKNHNQLKNANFNEWLQYKFPLWFGYIISVVIIYALMVFYFDFTKISTIINGL